jgi:hypothetical protein
MSGSGSDQKLSDPEPLHWYKAGKCVDLLIVENRCASQRKQRSQAGEQAG